MLRRYWRDLVSAVLSLAVHAVAGLLLLFGLPFGETTEVVQPVVLVEAVFLDISRERLTQQREQEAEKRRQEAERERAEEQQRQAEVARKKAADDARRKAVAEAQRKAEEAQRQRQEEERQREALERARRAAEEEALRRAEQEKERRAEEEARRKAEAEAEAKRKAEDAKREKAEAEKRRKEEAARVKAQRQRELREALAAEQEAMQRVQDVDDRALYVNQIASHVRRRWTRPAGAQEDFRCKVRITQLPGGQIANVEILESCGNSFLDDSVENAVRKSDPLPLPANRRVFERVIIFNFKP